MVTKSEYLVLNKEMILLLVEKIQVLVEKDFILDLDGFMQGSFGLEVLEEVLKDVGIVNGNKYEDKGSDKLEKGEKKEEKIGKSKKKEDKIIGGYFLMY